MKIPFWRSLKKHLKNYLMTSRVKKTQSIHGSSSASEEAEIKRNGFYDLCKLDAFINIADYINLNGTMYDPVPFFFSSPEFAELRNLMISKVRDVWASSITQTQMPVFSTLFPSRMTSISDQTDYEIDFSCFVNLASSNITRSVPSTFSTSLKCLNLLYLPEPFDFACISHPLVTEVKYFPLFL
jgi:hypothetical protein